MRNPCYPLTPAGEGGIMGATLARVQRATAAEPWYNTYCCAQKPPEIGALVTLARGARRESRAACVVSKSKTHIALGLAAIATWVSVA